MEAIYWPSVFFLLFGALACGFALAVLLSTNIVRMAFYLVLSLAATAGLFFLAGQEFVGAMQLLIYVGGTLVLLIFGVMLTSQERFVNMKTMAGDWVIGMIAGGALLSLLTAAAFSVPEWRGPERAAVENPFGVAGYCVKSLAMALGEIYDWRETGKSKLPLEIVPDGEFTHNALEDAIYQQSLHFAMVGKLHG